MPESNVWAPKYYMRNFINLDGLAQAIYRKLANAVPVLTTE